MTETETESGIVSGIVVDTDYTRNSSNIVEAVENTELNMYNIIIRERQINVMILSGIDIMQCFLNVINGHYYYLILSLCPFYGYIGARDLKYKYLRIYTGYLLAIIFIRFLLCLNYYHTLGGGRVIQYNIPSNITHGHGHTHESQNLGSNILSNSVYLLVDSYIYSYIHKFKIAVIQHRNRAMVVGIARVVDIVDTV